jgi:hypothetical protein
MQTAEFKIEPKLDKELSLTPAGWKKITILYSTEVRAGINYLCWKVKTTDHIFRIPTQIVYENHGLNYKEHFEKVLQVFRQDYLEWERQGFPLEWMQKYRAMFSNLIL